jgi:hypothetical protein
MALYSKLKNIVNYYEKNEQELISGYISKLQNHLDPYPEGPYQEPEKGPHSFEDYIVFSYTHKKYFKSLYKKHNGTFHYKDIPTCELMDYIKNITREDITNEMVREYTKFGGDRSIITLNGEKLKTLLFSYNDEMSVSEQDKLDTFINSI